LRGPTASATAAASPAADGRPAASASAICRANGVAVAHASCQALRKGLALGCAPPHTVGQIGARSLRAEPL